MSQRRQFLKHTLFGAAALALPWRGSLAAAEVLAGTSSRPRPTPQQLAWQRDELAMFVHLTVNTFTGKEWGEGNEDPRIFNPKRLDARQWARTAREAGFRSMILTAKHHDGFCLWPTRTTAHSVRSSPWRDGKGDVVREFVDACRAEGLKPGLYLSPWDRNNPSYGTPHYNDFYIAQLTELLSNYGPLTEMWFDGANGEGPQGRHQTYDWDRIHRTVRRLQPGAVMFSDAGPDLRWIGNEHGVAGETCWSTVDPASVPYPGFDAPDVGKLLGEGDPMGRVWRPGETDVSIRPGWFWHAAENAKVRSVDNLLGLYFSSVGRNSKLLLNVPPNQDGLFEPVDVERLHGFAARRQQLFANNLARGAKVSAPNASGHTGAGLAGGRMLDGDPDTCWSAPAGAREAELIVDLPAPVRFDTIELQEAIRFGQGIAAYRVEGWKDGGWTPLSRGTTIGCKKLDRIAPTQTGRLRLVVERALDTPRLSGLGIYEGSVSITA